MPDFKKNFDKIRAEKELKMEWIALEMGISYPGLQNIRRNSNPQYNNIIKLSKAMGVEPMAFFME